MTKLIKILLFFILISFNIHASDKPYVTVLPFKVAGFDSALSNQLADAFIARLFESNKYNVIERSQLDAILKEQALQTSGACSDNACMIEIGQLAGVQYIFVGSLSKLKNKIILTAKKLNVETGVIETQKYKILEGEIEDIIINEVPKFVDFFLYPPPQKITFAEDSLTLKVGAIKSIQLHFTPINSSQEVSFKYDKNIISVINDSKIKALTPGKTSLIVQSVGNPKAYDEMKIFVLDTMNITKINTKKTGTFTKIIRYSSLLLSMGSLSYGLIQNKEISNKRLDYNMARNEEEATKLGDEIEDLQHIRDLSYIVSASTGLIFTITLFF